MKQDPDDLFYVPQYRQSRADVVSVVKKVLENHADTQINLGSETAREILTEEIVNALNEN